MYSFGQLSKASKIIIFIIILVIVGAVGYFMYKSSSESSPESSSTSGSKSTSDSKSSSDVTIPKKTKSSSGPSGKDDSQDLSFDPEDGIPIGTLSAGYNGDNSISTSLGTGTSFGSYSNPQAEAVVTDYLKNNTVTLEKVALKIQKTAIDSPVVPTESAAGPDVPTTFSDWGIAALSNPSSPVAGYVAYIVLQNMQSGPLIPELENMQRKIPVYTKWGMYSTESNMQKVENAFNSELYSNLLTLITATITTNESGSSPNSGPSMRDWAIGVLSNSTSKYALNAAYTLIQNSGYIKAYIPALQSAFNIDSTSGPLSTVYGNYSSDWARRYVQSQFGPNKNNTSAIISIINGNNGSNCKPKDWALYLLTNPTFPNAYNIAQSLINILPQSDSNLINLLMSSYNITPSTTTTPPSQNPLFIQFPATREYVTAGLSTPGMMYSDGEILFALNQFMLSNPTYGQVKNAINQNTLSGVVPLPSDWAITMIGNNPMSGIGNVAEMLIPLVKQQTTKVPGTDLQKLVSYLNALKSVNYIQPLTLITQAVMPNNILSTQWGNYSSETAMRNVNDTFGIPGFRSNYNFLPNMTKYTMDYPQTVTRNDWAIGLLTNASTLDKNEAITTADWITNRMSKLPIEPNLLTDLKIVFFS